MNLRKSALMLASMALASVAMAGIDPNPIYINDSSGRLGTIGLDGVYTNIGTTMDAAGRTLVFGDIAITPDGTMYGTTFDNDSSLYKIDKFTGLSTYIGQTGKNFTAGLTSSVTGVVYGDDPGRPSFNSFDTGTGAASFIGIMGSPTDGDFSFDPNDKLFMTGGGNLHSVDVATGATTPIGAAGGGLFGLVYANGSLYGFHATDGVFKIDSSTGLSTFVAPYSGTPDQWFTYGAAVNPVPEPASMTALAIGVAALLRRRRK